MLHSPGEPPTLKIARWDVAGSDVTTERDEVGHVYRRVCVCVYLRMSAGNIAMASGAELDVGQNSRVLRHLQYRCSMRRWAAWQVSAEPSSSHAV